LPAALQADRQAGDLPPAKSATATGS